MSAARPAEGASGIPRRSSAAAGPQPWGFQAHGRVVTRWFAALALTALITGAPAPAAAEAPLAQDWTAIRGVIETQLAALKRDDARGAFAFATRALRQQFGNPDKFMQMVHAGYAPLLDARYTEFLDGAVIDGMTIQPLRLVLPDNTVLVALYQMQKEGDGRWRVAGCMLAPSKVKAA
jgi:hypothetical protein